VPIAILFHELASGNNTTLFDHTTEMNPKTIVPAEAARGLVAFQSFAVGGLTTLETGQDPKQFKSADNAPLVKGAVALVKGENLFQTLMLNLHHYNIEDEEPFPSEPDDAPVWERDDEIRAEERRPKGYLDLLTWQSRRVRLHPEQDRNGQTVVRKVVRMKGNQFPDGFILHNKETMLSFNKIDRPRQGQAPWLAVTFREDRALWRDSLTLFQSVHDKRARPRTLTWLNDLANNGIISSSSVYSLSLMGLTTNQAVVLLWRHERLPLPLKYLEDENLVAMLERALNIAEEAGRLLDRLAWNLSRLTIAPNAEKLNKEQSKEIRNFRDHLAPGRSYWSQLGVSFNHLLTRLAYDQKEDEHGEIVYGVTAMPWWAREVRDAATEAFENTTRGLDRSARMLKAVIKADQIFRSQLGAILRLDHRKGGEA
jgi:CRISPR system Cascade subunit CasA